MSNEEIKKEKPTTRRGGPVMGGPPGMGGPGEKAKNFKGTMKKLTVRLGNFKIAFLLVLIFAIGSTIFTIIGPTIMGDATTKISEGIISKIKGGAGIDFDALGKILITLIVLYAISAIFSLVQGFFMTDISQKVTYKFRKDISEKIHRMPMNYFDTTSHGEILSRVTNDVDTLGQSLNQSLSQLITSVITIIGVLIMMLRISISMTFLALLILPLSGIVISKVVKKSQKYFKQQQEYLGHVNGQV